MMKKSAAIPSAGTLPKKRSRRHRSRFPAFYVALILVLLYIPVVTVVVYSFNRAPSGAAFTGFTTQWYAELFDDSKFIPPLINSLTLGAASALLAAVCGTAAAVAAASRSFKTRGAVETLSMLPIMLPEIILAIAFLSLFSYIGLGNDRLMLLLAHTTFCIPYVYIVVKGRLRDLDRSVVEAARTLGASPLRAFVTVTLPLCLPAVLSGMFLAFAMSFDDVIISAYLIGPRTEMLPVKIYSQLKVGITPELNALFALMLGVVLLCVTLFTVLSRVFRGRR